MWWCMAFCAALAAGAGCRREARYVMGMGVVWGLHVVAMYLSSRLATWGHVCSLWALQQRQQGSSVPPACLRLHLWSSKSLAASHGDQLVLYHSPDWPLVDAPRSIWTINHTPCAKVRLTTHPTRMRSSLCSSTHNIHPQLAHMQACLQPRQPQPRRLWYFWPAGQAPKEAPKLGAPGTGKHRLGVWEGLPGRESCGMKLLWMLCWTGMSEECCGVTSTALSQSLYCRCKMLWS